MSDLSTPPVGDASGSSRMIWYGYFRSSSSYRLRIAFGLKGIDAELRPVHLLKDQHKAEAYRALNPQGLVPTVEVEGHVLTNSPAILEWLEESHPEPPLLPADRWQRTAVRAFCAAIACEIHPLQNLRVLRYLRRDLGHEQPAIDAWARHWVAEGLAACEALLADRPATAFAFGDRPGMAEVYLVPQLFSAARFGVDLGPMPRLRAIDAACAALPAFAAAHPSRQPDAE